jgi:hypothetical protein
MVVGRSGGRDGDQLKVRAAITEGLLARPPRLPVLPTGSPVTLRGGPRSPAALWFDTGRLVMHDPATRQQVAAALAEAVVTVAKQVRRAGGLLMPGGWTGRAEGAEADFQAARGACGPVRSPRAGW